MAPIDVAQSLENLKLERDAIALYNALAGVEKDARRAEAFRTIAGNERRHAEVWANKLRALGAEVPEPSGPRLRIRTIVLIARLFGTHTSALDAYQVSPTGFRFSSSASPANGSTAITTPPGASDARACRSAPTGSPRSCSASK